MQLLRLRVAGAVRYLRTDDNPLRRPLDRAHARVVIAFILLFLGTAPLVTVTTGWAIYSAGRRAEHHEAMSHYPVDAVVIGAGRTTAPVAAARPDSQIRWRGPSGAVRTGYVPHLNNDHVGAHRTVWTDRAGNLSDRPRTRSQTLTETVITPLGALCGLTVLVVSACTLITRRLERRRLALWEEEWLTVAPRWTGHV